MPPVIAIDAMGGDRAPAEIVAGALEAVDACDVDVLLVGPADVLRAHLPGNEAPARVEILDASEVIAMHEEPASAVRARSSGWTNSKPGRPDVDPSGYPMPSEAPW